ncbi:MAG: HAD family hydrolase [Acidimicrobiia bacterium]
MGVRHLVCDFGGVVLCTPFELRDRAEEALGLAPGTLDWAGPFGDDPRWQRVEAGELTERAYWASRVVEVAARTGRTGLEVRQLFATMYDAPEDRIVRSELVGVIRRVRAAGGRVAVLTNDLEAFHGPAWVARISVLREVDAVVDGSRTGVLKPDPRAYRAALDALGVPAATTVFVDDQPTNLEGAASVGLVPVRFDPADVTGSVAMLEAALGLVPRQDAPPQR